MQTTTQEQQQYPATETVPLQSTTDALNELDFNDSKRLLTSTGNYTYDTTATPNTPTLLTRLKQTPKSIDEIDSMEVDEVREEDESEDDDSVFEGLSNASDEDWDDVVWKQQSDVTNEIGAEQDNQHQALLMPCARKGGPLVLPAELYLSIAAYLKNPSDIIRFMKTSQRALSSLAPIIYRNPNIRSSHSLTLFLRTVVASKAFESRYYMSMIKHIDFRYLSLSDNDLFDVIDRCTKLEALTVHSKTITCTSLSHMSSTLKELNLLDISSCENVEMKILIPQLVSATYRAKQRIQSALDNHLLQHPSLYNLSYLDFARTRVSDAEVKQVVTAFPKLHTLKLDGCRKVTNASLKHLSMYGSSLKHLSLEDCRITDFGVSIIANRNSLLCSGLQDLNLNKSAISPLGVSYVLENMTGLSQFSAKGCALNQGTGLPFYLREFPDDVESGFENFEATVSDEKEGVFVHMPRQGLVSALKFLNLTGIKILDQHVVSGLGMAKYLESVDFDSCGITVETIRTITQIKTLEVE
ncbi:UNVERIFIED_CONTAM: hypothetical protein HDU68_011989 [Siphonaria sp. JEL0065]|nr:hypothetical protein HDU68_011989 [Siphonaria sp. JEL0065]